MSLAVRVRYVRCIMHPSYCLGVVYACVCKPNSSLPLFVRSTCNLACTQETAGAFSISNRIWTKVRMLDEGPKAPKRAYICVETHTFFADQFRFVWSKPVCAQRKEEHHFDRIESVVSGQPETVQLFC